MSEGLEERDTKILLGIIAETIRGRGQESSPPLS